MKKTLGGERLGNGKKIKVDLHGWGRSTFDQSRIWRSTMPVGTLIPCFGEIGTNGSTFNIDINALGHTIPTISPLFGSFKMQVDFFACPFRLYQGLLHNNAVNIGMDMSKVYLPKIILNGTNKKTNSSSLLNYIGIKGTAVSGPKSGEFNAIPILAYYDIFKNYYANKQEEYAKVISTMNEEANIKITKFTKYNPTDYETAQFEAKISDMPEENQRRLFNQFSSARTTSGTIQNNKINIGYAEVRPNNFITQQNTFGDQLDEWLTTEEIEIKIESTEPNENGEFTPNFKLDWIEINIDGETGRRTVLATNIEENAIKNQSTQLRDRNSATNAGIVNYNIKTKTIKIRLTNPEFNNFGILHDGITINFGAHENIFKIRDFKLENIDDARREILAKTNLQESIVISESSNDLSFLPYSANVEKINEKYESLDKQGLVLKTYLNDIYNTWLSTEYVELVNNISSIATDEGSFSMDALILAKKVYNVLNRIAVSGGTYEDWQEANWGEDAIQRAESPIYIGGMSQEIVFEEVVSTSQTETQPLATLAGKGTLNNKKGGNITFKCNEPTFIMGIVSITPRIDYHQGNKWYLTKIETLDDLHKPGLDGIGFANLMSNNVHWKAPRNQAVAKQPAWLDYQTAVNEVFGQFAKDGEEENNLSQMVLRRNYEVDGNGTITDFTSYIDPSKYNYAFAVNGLESENFWIQLGFDVKSRRKMAAYEIPNL